MKYRLFDNRWTYRVILHTALSNMERTGAYIHRTVQVFEAAKKTV